MNVWIGRSPVAEAVVDEWATDMTNWTNNYLKMSYLKFVGVGVEVLERSGGDPHRPLRLIVVLYE
jgi:hypothetical protein